MPAVEVTQTAAEFTTRVTWALCDVVPFVPVMVSVYVPGGVELEVETVSVEEPEPPLTEVGLKLNVAPVGNPLKPKDTVPLKPLIELTVAV